LSFRPVSIALDAARLGQLTVIFLPDSNTLAYFARLSFRPVSAALDAARLGQLTGIFLPD
jgi:hypothetical protein